MLCVTFLYRSTIISPKTIFAIRKCSSSTNMFKIAYTSQNKADLQNKIMRISKEIVMFSEQMFMYFKVILF
jgi:hypothetical protein